MVSCRQARASILRAVDGELDVSEVSRLDEHVGRCAECARYREDQMELVDWAGLLPEPALERVDLEADR